MKYLETYDQINELLKNERLSRYYAWKIIKDLEKYGIVNKHGAEIYDNNGVDDFLEFIIQYDKIFSLKSNVDFIKKQIFKILENYKRNLLKSDLILGYTDSPESKLVRIVIKSIYNKRVNPPRYVYHATDNDSLKEIKKSGLKPKSSIEGRHNNSGADISYPPMIFAVTTGESFWNKIQVKIDTKDLPNKWWQDLNFTDDEDENEFIMTNEPIPLKYLEFPDDN